MTAGTFLLASLLCAFPPEGARMPAVERCYVIGSAETNAAYRLSLNGVEVPVYRTGGWIAMVRVSRGTNRLEIAQGTNRLTRTFCVLPPSPPKPPATNVPPRNVWADVGVATNVPPRGRPTPETPRSQIRVMVDPGHGAHETGALAPSGTGEKVYNLLQAEAIAASLRRAGFTVVLTRETDAHVPLYARPKRACAENIDLFISVHHNATACATDPRDVRYTATFYWNDLGKAAAEAIQRHIGRVSAPVRDLGAQWKSLAVCRNPVVPSCLLEVDFVNCPEGEERICDPTYRAKVADAVTLGVLDWVYEGTFPRAPGDGAKTATGDR